ncbi:ABC transporter substrate-binding protein [Mycolicibacterium bacteremicum]|uniref:ABC transporter substrate-binding protein n=1 Tax=Mycolicibacterium bacteremicum TaxID=564198 RepID=A0A1W9YSB2_MYCBA|nr:ABC transporter substrate-binding protein [Mycolicibacterium bacteremicum]MCV7431175.1 ABC transporter substrate-binding protein [Mycolicibacterium bacteremicum]ORA02847.1 ABC transporter substrate-binding protein [Mycolicibacterium bacteremicum]
MRLRAIAVALSALLAAACGASSDTASTADGKTIIRYQGWASQVTFPELAENLGYFEKIKLNWVGNTTSGPQNIQATATGDIDVGGAFNGAVVKLVSAGAPITSIIGYYGSDKENFTGYYVLEDSPIRTARDLIGRKFGMNTLGAHQEFVMREWLAREGLSPDEIKQVELTVVPPVNAEQTLRSHNIDAVALFDIWRDEAVARGGIRPLFTDGSLFGDFTYGTYIVRNDFLQANREAVADLTQGTARAVRWAQVTPREQVIAKFKEIINARGRNENVEKTDYWKSTGVAEPGGVIDPKSLQLWIDWLVRNGELEEGKLTPEQFFTNEFNPYANGTYPPAAGPDGQALRR